ncbi:MAG: hypothetical protein ACKOBS_03580, partial [Verrucomicrobiota bacterium]
RYSNGPIIKADARKDLPEFEAVVTFRTELAENDTPVGVMVNSPAMVQSTFGLGRVFTSSPHPEQTAGLEPIVVKAVRWAARSNGPTEELWKRLEGMEVDKLWFARGHRRLEDRTPYRTADQGCQEAYALQPIRRRRGRSTLGTAAPAA